MLLGKRVKKCTKRHRDKLVNLSKQNHNIQLWAKGHLIRSNQVAFLTCSRNLCKETISPLRLLTSLHWQWFKSSQLIQKQISQLKTVSPRGTIISEADVILKSRQSHSVFGLISSATLETATNMTRAEKLEELLKKRIN